MGAWKPDPGRRLSAIMAEHDADDMSHPTDYAHFVEMLEDENLALRARNQDMRHTLTMQGHEVQELAARIDQAKLLCKQLVEQGRQSTGHPGDKEWVASRIASLLHKPLDVWPDDIESFELRELREAYDALARKHQQVCVELARRVTESIAKSDANG